MYWVRGVAASTIPDMEKNRGSDDRGGRSLGQEMMYPAPWQQSSPCRGQHQVARVVPGREGREERRSSSRSWEGEESWGSQLRL